ncbi:Ig-like domain-containing protein [Actinospongicola halichondriae]|uniref:Ig-like domain-containing protein n=1 Tax=Actinospongicola halichondriae TaxID=3236844 RepID=UPI003D4E22E3
MRTPSRRRYAALAVLGLVAGLLPLVLGASPASAGTVTSPNVCTNTAQAGTSQLDVTMSGDGTPSPIVLGAGDIDLTGATFSIDVPPTVLLAGYGLNLLTVGVNNIPAEVTLEIIGSNTTQGSQTVGPLAVVGTTTITDPTPANKTSGDESATPLAVSAPVPTTTWTPTGGDVGLRLGTSATTALVGPGGVIAVTFTCQPGTPGPAGCGPLPLPVQCTTEIPAPAAPFSTVTVTAPPTAPVCTNESASVGITQTIPIDLTDNCTDVNGNIDPTTFSITPPSAGTLTGSNGVYSYEAPATDPGGPVVLDFTVEDTGGLVSNTGQVSITILANSCDATSGPCSLTEIVVQPVVGTTMTLDKVDGLVVMSPVVLNGQAQASTGSLQDVTVTNARGTAAGWTVSGFITDLGAPGSPTITVGAQTFAACSAAGSLGTVTDGHRLCIPGDNMGWAPAASIAHDVIFGDVAQVAGGPADAADAADWLGQLIAAGAAGVDGIGGLTEVNELCSAPVDHAGGTFACDAALFLGVPASAGAGTYTGGLVLTLL